jgi:hypothetical protein
MNILLGFVNIQLDCSLWLVLSTFGGCILFQLWGAVCVSVSIKLWFVSVEVETAESEQLEVCALDWKCAATGK